MKRLLIPIVAMIFAVNVFSYDTGNQLFEDLKSDEPIRSASSMQFINGVSLGFFSAETLFSNQPKRVQCAMFASGVTLGQLKDTVKKYLDQNPNERHLPATVLIMKSLAIAFPCDTK